MSDGIVISGLFVDCGRKHDISYPHLVKPQSLQIQQPDSGCQKPSHSGHLSPWLQRVLSCLWQSAGVFACALPDFSAGATALFLSVLFLTSRFIDCLLGLFGVFYIIADTFLLAVL
jgi:hypothetical protein